MIESENIFEFYERNFGKEFLPDSICEQSVGHFNIFSRNHCANMSPYQRRDYYKISLIIGTGTLHYADRWIRIDRPALLFSNPNIPFSWEAESELQEGWFCLFTEKFIQQENTLLKLKDSPQFRSGGEPVFFLAEEQALYIGSIFQKMMVEIQSDYIHKYDLLRNYLQLLLHETLKMNPAENFQRYKNASQRIVLLFMELLERQFPIDSPENYLKLKTANDYANNLNIHVNSLNRALKDITQKTTSALITERIIQEAKTLLQHSDWNINEIAYGLGFEESAYFTNYFKRKIGLSPNHFRKTI